MDQVEVGASVARVVPSLARSPRTVAPEAQRLLRPDASRLRALLDRALDMPGAVATAQRFLPELVARERGVRAVLLYGSCLWPHVRGQASHPDFIVIADSLRAFHGSVRSALLGAVLPPTVYRLR